MHDQPSPRSVRDMGRYLRILGTVLLGCAALIGVIVMVGLTVALVVYLLSLVWP